MHSLPFPSVQPQPLSRTEVIPGGRRALDLLGCLLALPLLALAALVMTVVTALVSPGPVIFRQRRIGHQGREFMIFKFRTMHVGSDQSAHQNHFKELVDSKAPMAKLDARRDARLLPGGRLLRASGLDELPQIINVLRGEMSLVGPRPCLPTEYPHYLPEQRERFSTLPGLTGLWQVSGKNRTTFEEMVRLDIRYARNASVPLNLKIILLTPVVLIGQINETRRRIKAAAPPERDSRSAYPSAAAAAGRFSKTV
jgi:lipopolysaccharide/colanic/teichoic acid biosynthesis glycosyltransferase